MSGRDEEENRERKKKQKVSQVIDRHNPSEDTNNGRPRFRPESGEYVTNGGVVITREMKKMEYDSANTAMAFDSLINALDSHRGCVFESAYEFPGRYARWTMGFSDPPISLETIGRNFYVRALNSRGVKMLPYFQVCLGKIDAVKSLNLVTNEPKSKSHACLQGVVKEVQGRFPEEERSKQHSVFSVVREIINMFKTPPEVDPQLGLYGAFGYELTFQFESVKLKNERDPSQRDLVLYIPDDILVMDKAAKRAWRLLYDFNCPGCESTINIPRGEGSHVQAFKPSDPSASAEIISDHTSEEYQNGVRNAIEEFKVGNLFEAVLSQVFSQSCKTMPSTIFRSLRIKNPSPYLLFLNLGEDEYLVGASPEMFVRAEHTSAGMRIETCPIAGTIRRGVDALQDAERIREIIGDLKEESELTMCTDVDRNDKSRVCIPGSVQVIGRRQIEKYSKLIHTVDHVEGYLRDDFDALDAFLVHTWAVTVTGAPKTWSIQFIESNEKTPRQWYSGAVGLIGFDGHMNTGLTLRTVRLRNGIAQVRSGATLLYDSNPESEERETRLKASALLEVISSESANVSNGNNSTLTTSSAIDSLPYQITQKTKVLFIDHQDSFVFTLVNYIRQTGADVRTVRFGVTLDELREFSPSLVVMSPGPGKPKDFQCSEALSMFCKEKIPVFGVCLGLQAMVEHFGGELGILNVPMHGKPSKVTKEEEGLNLKWDILSGLPKTFTVARYHSLYGKVIPPSLLVTSRTSDGVVMSIEHRDLPVAGVQFHPESILTAPSDGMTILLNAMKRLRYV